MIRTRVGPVLMTVFLVVAGEAGAQTAVDISVLDRGKPVGNVNISAILDEGKVVVGTSNATGQVTLDMNALNITKGTEVTVWIKTCEDGRVEVILVPAGKEGECVEEGVVGVHGVQVDDVSGTRPGPGSLVRLRLAGVGRTCVTSCRSFLAAIAPPGLPHVHLPRRVFPVWRNSDLAVRVLPGDC